jgi:glycosyltransferase involved in cell wall biosynthesis
VWTLHDSWAFTGGCHIPLDCLRYEGSCGSCPQLNSQCEHDLSRWVWERKRKAWSGLAFRVVTPSRWLGKCAASSSLLRDKCIEVIPNGIDTTIFKPLDKRYVRESLNVPVDKKIILMGGVRSLEDPNKGFRHLLASLEILAAEGWKEKAELIVFGDEPPIPITGIPFPTRFVGYLNDDLSMALLYSAADVFAAPSVQENLPNTVMEALACGTPSVAFNIGGMPDLIAHKETGYLAQAYLKEDLAAGISWVLSDEQRWVNLSRNARQRVETKFSIALAADRYRRLYNEVIGTCQR